MESGLTGCALCGATWGAYWDEVDGKKLFFCCKVCARAYRTIVEEAKKRMGWASVDDLEMKGDHRWRTCTALRGTESYRFMITFFDDGRVRTFLDLD